VWAVWTPTSKKGGIAGVPFDSVGSLRTTLLLHTTCMRSWCNRSANCVAAYKPKTKNWCLFCVCVLLCFINPRVRKIRHEASSCPRIFSRTLRFYYSLAPGALVHPPPLRVSPEWPPNFVSATWSKESTPPGGVFYLQCFLIKNSEEEGPPRRICTRRFEGGPLPPGSWWGIFCLMREHND